MPPMVAHDDHPNAPCHPSIQDVIRETLQIYSPQAAIR
jgi:hypothetical protein